jgi:hypothetical protein
MRRPVLLTTLALIALTFSAAPVRAWNRAGHLASGAIAFDVLKGESPQTLAAVVALLRRHPQFGTRWEDAVFIRALAACSSSRQSKITRWVASSS